jgi:hypothetical protein
VTIECYDDKCHWHSAHKDKTKGPFCYEPMCKKQGGEEMTKVTLHTITTIVITNEEAEKLKRYEQDDLAAKVNTHPAAKSRSVIYMARVIKSPRHPKLWG